MSMFSNLTNAVNTAVRPSKDEIDWSSVFPEGWTWPGATTPTPPTAVEEPTPPPPTTATAPTQPSGWEANKNHIVSLVESGQADASTQAWYDRWVASGSPETKAGMMSLNDYEAAQQQQQQPQEPQEQPQEQQRPEGVSQYVWDRVTAGTTAGLNLTLITNRPEVRDALIAAGYEDYVKGVYEQAMDQRAAHYMGNGASSADAWNTAQLPWYAETYGSGYTNDTVEGVAPDLGLGHEPTDPADNPGYVPPVVTPPTTEEPPTEQPPAVDPGMTPEERDEYMASVNEAMQTGLYGSEGVDNTWGSGSAGGQGMFGQAYGSARPPANPNHAPNPHIPNGTGVGVDPSAVGQAMPLPVPDVFPTQSPSTPYADAYIRAKNAAEQPNAVTSIFGAELNK